MARICIRGAYKNIVKANEFQTSIKCQVFSRALFRIQEHMNEFMRIETFFKSILVHESDHGEIKTCALFLHVWKWIDGASKPGDVVAIKLGTMCDHPLYQMSIVLKM